jgi:hypothetical protein
MAPLAAIRAPHALRGPACGRTPSSQQPCAVARGRSLPPDPLAAPCARALPGIVLGKHSGRNALSSRLRALGAELSQGELDDVFKRFKALADKKKRVSDEDILALMSDELHQPEVIWELLDLQVGRGGAALQERGGLGTLAWMWW